MSTRRTALRLVALTVVMAMPLVGIAGVASAKTHKHHHQPSGGGSGSGGTGTSPTMIVTASPNPLVETYQSLVVAVVQVATSPAFAGDDVDLTSSQFSSTCTGVSGLASLPLDDEGNALGIVIGEDCAPGTSLIEASLTSAPYYTATVELVVSPPTVTTPGVYGYPTSSGTVSGGDVETGDSGTAQSVVIAVFYVETDPVYAEQKVELTSPEMLARCGTQSALEAFTPPNTSTTPGVAEGTLDDDGNAVFIFVGTSCAAGSSVVTADVDAGTHPTYTTTFNILPPLPTI
ncbi:MAG: hypothetical protein ACRDY1_09295 [Acidimicrobiales bacterium]